MDNDIIIKAPNKKYFQPNTIARAVYDMETVTKKLLAYAIHIAFTNNRDYPPLKATFTISDFQNSLGMKKGGKSKLIIISAIEELLTSFISIDDGNLYQAYSWVSYARYDNINNEINIKFSEDISEKLRDFKLGYSTVDLIKIGSLKSKHAIRWYELARSNYGHLGKGKNKKNQYYFEYSIEQIRTIFNLKNKYTDTNNFKNRVIERPIKELNDAHINMRIETDFKYLKKKLVSVIFNVTVVSDIEEKRIITDEREQQEIERIQDNINSYISELKANYNNEYNSLFSEVEQEKLAKPIGRSLARKNKVSFAQIVENETIKRLAKKYNKDLFILLTTTE